MASCGQVLGLQQLTILSYCVETVLKFSDFAMPLVVHLVSQPSAQQACLLTSGLFASGIFSRRTLTMASGYAGLAPGRPGRDPNGNGPFDCHGVLAPDPACCSFLGQVRNAKRIQKKCQNSLKDRELGPSNCLLNLCDWF